MAYGRLGHAYEHAGFLAQAIAAYRRELELRPRAVEARVGLAGALIKTGRPVEALDELLLVGTFLRRPPPELRVAPLDAATILKSAAALPASSGAELRRPVRARAA